MVELNSRHESPGHACAECNGTGMVLVFPHRESARPLREFIGTDDFGKSAMPYAERCGVCGGDGWISRIDELTGDQQTPIDWLLGEKQKMRTAMRKQIDAG